MKALVFFIEKKQFCLLKKTITKNKTKCHFGAPPILNIFHENFRDWSLGLVG